LANFQPLNPLRFRAAANMYTLDVQKLGATSTKKYANCVGAHRGNCAKKRHFPYLIFRKGLPKLPD
jgi:hypothetical protein